MCRPCRLTTLFRIIGQFSLLSLWYPDTYELNRVFPNLDHLFAGWEQTIFGCQPSLTFSEVFHWPVFSELMTMGYVSYFPLFASIAMFYFIWRYDKFERATFVILTSFFIFYVIFILLPVAGPQFYFKAIGVEQAAAGIFPQHPGGGGGFSAGFSGSLTWPLFACLLEKRMVDKAPLGEYNDATVF